MLAKLDQFIFTEDVQLGDVTETFAQIAVVGPDAAARSSARSSTASSATRCAALPEHGNLRAAIGAASRRSSRASTDTGEPGFDLFVERAQADALASGARGGRRRRARRGDRRGAADRGGVPLFDRDMDEETIPLEAGIESRAISFTKGCYVGQEVIIRVLHRGHGRVARKLVGLTLDGDAAAGAGRARSAAAIARSAR